MLGLYGFDKCPQRSDALAQGQIPRLGDLDLEGLGEREELLKGLGDGAFAGR
jgi:hypothetical protein